jgi:uncharacterized protein YukJ
LQTGPGGAGLDYLRDDLFPIDAMAPIPPDGQGVTLRNLLDAQIKRAKADRSAVVIAFANSFKTGAAMRPSALLPNGACTTST